MMPNALKSFLIIELPTKDINIEKACLMANNVSEYVKKEIGYYDNINDDTLKILVFNSDKLNIQLLNSPYDAWERFGDTLSQKFNNIEEFIKEIYK